MDTTTFRQGTRLRGCGAGGADPGVREGGHRPEASKGWKPVSDRKIRVGIAGYGVCRFGAAFGFQDHPNVEVVAVTDLDPDKCAALAKACRCEKTYPSCEEMIKDDSHRGRVRRHRRAEPRPAGHRGAQGRQARRLGRAGGLRVAGGRRRALRGRQDHRPQVHDVRDVLLPRGPLRHAADVPGPAAWARSSTPKASTTTTWRTPIASYKGWRDRPAAAVVSRRTRTPTTSGVTGGSFTEVSCMGMPSIVEHLQPENNRYRNPFGTEIALFRTSEGGMARMAVSWDTPGRGGEMGRIRGQKGTFYGKFEGAARRTLPRIDASAASSGGRGRRPRRLARLPDERVRRGDPAGPQAPRGRGPGPEHDGRRHRRPPVGAEGRRTAEDPAVRPVGA